MEEKMASRRVATFGCTLIVLLTFCVAASDIGSAEGPFGLGDIWIYDFDMTVGTLSLSGTMTYSFIGESSKNISGIAYETYEMSESGSLEVTGTFYGTWAFGTATITGTDSMDRESLDLIVSDINLSMTLSVPTQNPPVTIDTWDHLISTYSPPGGIGQVPEDFKVGSSWTKNYTIESVETSFDSRFRAITNDSHSYSSTCVYTYLGTSSVIVPAGKFECEKVTEDDEYGVTTSWICEKVGMVVKSEYNSGFSDSITQLLVSYSYTPSPQEDWSPAMVLASLGVPLVAVNVTVVIWMANRRQVPRQDLMVDQTPLGSRPPIPPSV
jgi:hypothetical protein